MIHPVPGRIAATSIGPLVDASDTPTYESGIVHTGADGDGGGGGIPAVPAGSVPELARPSTDAATVVRK
jgi:hypothetical protein